ncbi:MAG: exosortase/archaeosortase family protein [Candidatus Omnitrophica bacterium]|nr:exosortase/archaeosortase family protein [Candidatus Omnitrophota bacterium]
MSFKIKLIDHRNFLFAFVLFIAAYIPTFIWMWDRWFAHDSYYSHGILVPFVTLFLIWMKREELGRTDKTCSAWGLNLIVFGILAHLFSSLFRIYFSSGFSLLLVLAGLILHFYGAKIFRIILFPVVFLVFMVPLPLVTITTISFKLKLIAAQLATLSLNHLGVPAVRQGSMIYMRDAYVVVEDVCSGLRSLISLTALSSVFAYLMKGNWWKRGMIFLSAVPIAIITNVARIMTLSLISEIWGSQYATGLIHDMTGFMVFALAFILLWFVVQLWE